MDNTESHEDIRRELDEVEKAIPAILEPRPGAGFLVLEQNPAHYFPDDQSSRWMLGLMTAHNDLGISLKLLTPFLAQSGTPGKYLIAYRTSHTIYFWRLMVSQVYEAWVLFNQWRKVNSSVISEIVEADDVKAAVREISDALGAKFERGKTVHELIERCRATTYHYYDKEGDSWLEQLKLIPMDQPLSIVPEPGRASDNRFIIADEYVFSRLNPVGFGNKELHTQALVPIAFGIIGLIRKISELYMTVREKTSTSSK